MSREPRALAEQLRALVANGSRCVITVCENGSQRRLSGWIASASAESIVLHETGNACIDVYPIESILAVTGPLEPPHRHHADPGIGSQESVDHQGDRLVHL